MERVAFKMKLFRGCEEEYKRRHDQLWPELKLLLTEHGISDYAIFLDEGSGDLFGVLQVADKLSLDRLPDHPIMQKWWDYMKDMMETNADNSPVSIPLKEVFYLP